MKTAFAVALITMLPAGFSLGQESGKEAAPVSPEMADVSASERAYEEAYAKGDVAAMAAFFTDDAEYTSDDGRTFNGKPSIEACLRDAFKVNKGARLSIDITSVKSIAPEVMIEKGTSSVVSKTGEVTGSLYTAVQVKKDGKWKISQLVETPLPEMSVGDRLAELTWLIGSWQEADKEAGVTVHSSYQWARGGSFITRSVTVKRGDDPVLEGWQIIGWDPVQGGIRSWTFDDEGGYSEGRWTREGQRWLVRESGYAPDGSRSSADQTITKTTDDRFFWQSDNRTLDGDPQPSIARIEISRQKGE
jgi:uncharacterized protein (TIGR02246 family)